ncbi:SET domain-containing protein-lysine N-methyltransferase [Patescibacteria group bacterium]|nr:SET domain-containing protein-lysine N-methyltransferase [Patescibacteria group bacterium]
MNIKSYLSPKTRVKKSLIEGRGLFGIRQIKKGELVGIKGGHIIGWKTLQRIRHLIGDSYFQIDDDFVIGPLKSNEVGKIMMFLNHSCNPNIGVRGEITFVAMRDIKAEEELTIDYAMVDNDIYKTKCNCAQKNCRKIIAGKDWQKKTLQKKYRGYFSRYIQDKIDKISVG